MTRHVARKSISAPHLSALSLAIAIALAGPAAHAATITVNDAGDPAVPLSTTCTLRQAIAAMNDHAAGGSDAGNCANTGVAFGTSDTINFDAAVTDIELDGSDNGELDILSGNDLLIDGGTGLGQVTINLASGAYSVIGTRGANVVANLTLTGLTITGGGEDGAGGGVFLATNDNTLTLNNSVVSGNHSLFGGGIYGYNVAVNNSTITGNYARYEGGGIAGYRTITVDHSTISNNHTRYEGGGIYDDDDAGSITITNSIITGNSVTGGGEGYSVGGGIFTRGYSLSISNSTISDNQTANYCGGAFAYQAIVSLTNSTVSGSNGAAICARDVLLTNSTVSGNSGNHASGIYVSDAIGLFNSTVSGNTGAGPAIDIGVAKGNPAGAHPALHGAKKSAKLQQFAAKRAALHAQAHPGRVHGALAGNVRAGRTQVINLVSNLTLYSSIVSDNTGASLDIDSSNAVTAAGGYNIVGNVGNNISLASLTNEVSGSPLLAALADNGCTVPAGEPSAAQCVQTMALPSGSPALDTGTTTPSGVTSDERGANFPRPSGAGTDIGAYEAIISPPTATPLVENVSFNTPLTFNLQGTDSNSGGPFTFTFAVATAPTYGTVSVNTATGSTTYTPTNGYSGPDSFTYTVTDANGTSTAATVSITVAAGVLPTAQPASAATTLNTPVGITLHATDPNPGTSTFTFSIATPPGHGTVVLGTATTTGSSSAPASSGGVQFSYSIAASNGTVTATYTPAVNYSGADSFTFTASNANGTSAPAPVSITVAAPPSIATIPTPALSRWAWLALIAQFGLIAWVKLRQFAGAERKSKR